MENTLVKLDAPELQVIEKSKAEAIRATFEPMVAMLREFEDAYNSVITASKKEVTKELTNTAKRLRLDIGKVRIEAEKLRKEQKEEYLRAGKAIDAVNNILRWAVTDKENRLKEIEDYFEIQDQLRLEKLQADRAEKLSKYVEDAHERNLASMDEDVWKAYFSTKKQEYEDRIAAEKKAEEDRKENKRLDKIENARRLEIAPYSDFIKKEALPDIRNMDEKRYQSFLNGFKHRKAEYDTEQERIRKENERIRKEQETERKKVEAERKARDEKQRKEREAFEAKLKKERKERQKAEAEIKAKKEAEEAERKKVEEEKRKAELAPDKEKLLAFAGCLDNIERPVLKSETTRQILSSAIIAIQRITSMIHEETENLK